MNIISLFNTAFGTGADDLSIWQILARTTLIFIFGIALVRIGKKRFLGKIAAFDTILAIIIGSLLSRAVTDTDYFLEILAASLLLIILHRAFSLVATYSDTFGNWIKGQSRQIIKDGKLLRNEMEKSNLSEKDVLQTLRQNAQTDDIKNVKSARLERNGDISFIMNF